MAYLPLQFMEQISRMITVKGHPSLQETVNTKCIKFVQGLLDEDRCKAFITFVSEWCKASGIPCDPNVPLLDIQNLLSDFRECTGLEPGDVADFTSIMLLDLIYIEWGKHKRVYKVEPSMMDTLCEMSVSRAIPIKAVAKLPLKCFYIDFSEHCPPCPRIQGCFVTSDISDSSVVWHLTCIVNDGDRVAYTNTVFYTELDEDGVDDGLAKIRLDAFKEKQRVTLDGGASMIFRERDFVRFFINFCTYLYAANNDVEYTERTRQVYKPRPEGTQPKNKIREVEEYGVGYRYSKNITSNQVRVKYVGEKQPTGVKRSYSSHYRCAHWHHYWVNDADIPGRKKLIVKWVEGVFVKGTKDSDKVVIQKVTK